jgi:2-iminobutanoate/2-iminopropanoate deaminase
MPLNQQEVIESKRVPRLGPYAQAVKVGNLVFTAGQPGIDPVTRRPPNATFEGQVRQAFSNLEAVLQDAGSGLERVIKVTCFVTDAAHFVKLNELFEEFFPKSPPARTTPIVVLPNHLLFSIEAIAVCEEFCKE